MVEYEKKCHGTTSTAATNLILMLLFLIVIIPVAGVRTSLNCSSSFQLLAWKKCQSSIQQDNHYLETHRMECAEVRVPLDWRRFDSIWNGTFDWIFVHVKRLKSLNSGKKGQIWIHNTPLFEFHKLVALEVQELFMRESSRFENYDIYFPSIRGSGESTPKLVCEFEEQSGHSFTSEKDIEACLSNTRNDKVISEKYGQYFHTYQIVRDIFHIIGMTKVESAHSDKTDYRIIHYGYGFNTFLIGRMMQIEKDMHISSNSSISESHVDMVIADSVFSMDIASIDLFNFDKRFNEVALSYLEECDRDTFCTGRLEQLHKSKGRISLRNLLNGIYLIFLKRCFSTNPYFFRDILTYFFYEDSLRHLLVPLIFRVSRCNDLDKNIIQDFFYHINHTILFENSHEKHETYSSFERVIGAFELMDHGYRFYKEEMARALDLSEYPFFTGLSLNMMKTYSLLFHSSHSNSTNFTQSVFTDFEKPLLVLHGSLDALSSINNMLDWKAFYSNESKGNVENHHFVNFPLVNHITILKTNCSLELVHTFIESGGIDYFHECLLEANASDHIRSQLFNESNWSEEWKNTTVKYFGTREALDGGLSISASEYYFLVVGLTVAGVLLFELFALLITLLVMSIRTLK